MSRTVTDTRGDAGAIVLSDESTARDYYEADMKDAAEYLRAVAHSN